MITARSLLHGLKSCLFLGSLLLLAWPLSCLGAQNFSSPAVMHTFGYWDTETQERLDIAVWFPGRSEGAGVVMDGWHIQAQRSTRIIPGFYPIVLISHDTASSRFANNDLAIALAQKGHIVIVPTHNGDNQNDSSGLYSAPLLSARPRHLLRALEVVLASQELAPYADESRIGLIGVGFGAITALQLAGAAPQWDNLEAFCQSAPDTDPFCTPWIKQRLATLPTEFKNNHLSHSALTPPLTLFAPLLIKVDVPGEPPTKQEKPKKEASKLSQLWSSVTSSSTPEPAPLPPAAPKERVEAQLELNLFQNDPTFLNVAFQVTTLFGASDGSEHATSFASSVVPHFRIAMIDEEPTAPEGVESGSDKGHKSYIYHRPAHTRQLRSIVLLAPAGGAFFPAQQLRNITVPIAIVEAEKNGLYTSEHHAHPLVRNLSFSPQVLNIPGADHFSLFAPCTQDMRQALGESCGRLMGAKRTAAAKQRNSFIQKFFDATLGDVAPVPEPSGLIVAPPPQPPSVPKLSNSTTRQEPTNSTSRRSPQRQRDRAASPR